MRLQALAKAAAPRIVRGALTAVVTCLPVGALAVVVTRKWQPLIHLDQSLIVAATNVTRANPGFRSALLAWQDAFVPLHTYLLTLPAVIWAWRSGLRARTIWAFITMMVGWNIGLDVKLLVERARPVYDDPVSSAPGFSFPSGHAFNVAMAVCGTIVLIWPLLKDKPAWVRGATLTGGAAMMVLTALDRVFLGVHFPSDVTAGALLAAGLTGASYAGFAHRPGGGKTPSGPEQQRPSTAPGA